MSTKNHTITVTSATLGLFAVVAVNKVCWLEPIFLWQAESYYDEANDTWRTDASPILGRGPEGFVHDSSEQNVCFIGNEEECKAQIKTMEERGEAKWVVPVR